MADTLITSTDMRGLRALGLQGEPALAGHAQFTALLAARLSQRHARFLAEPLFTGKDQRVDWYTKATGTVTPFLLLPDEEREKVEAEVGEIVVDIGRIAQELIDSGRDHEVLLGQLLELALKVPSTERLYVVGDQPVAVCWAHVEDATEDDAPSPLAQFIPAAPPPAAAAPASGTATPTAAAFTPAPPPAQAAPVAPAPAPAGGGWQWALFLVGLVALVVLAAWLLHDIGLEDDTTDVADNDGPPPDTGPPPPPPVDTSPLIEELGRARDLRIWLAALEHELAEEKSACEPAELIIPYVPPEEDEDSVAEDEPADEEPAEDEQAEDETSDEDPADEEPADEEPVEDDAPDEESDEEVIESLVVPDSAEVGDDMAFLEGCWQSITDLVNQDDVPIAMEYCFETDGTGVVNVAEEGGIACSGPVDATLSPNRGLTIATHEAIECDNGGSYRAWTIECTSDDDTRSDCQGVHEDGATFEVAIQR